MCGCQRIPEIKKLLQLFGVTKFTELKEEDYAGVIQEADLALGYTVKLFYRTGGFKGKTLTVKGLLRLLKDRPLDMPVVAAWEGIHAPVPDGEIREDYTGQKILALFADE